MLQLGPGDRDRIWSSLIQHAERYMAHVDDLPVSPELAPEKIRTSLAQLNLAEPMSADKALDYAADALTKWQVHTPHPMYFGLFNPAPTTIGIAADTLVAAFNPQLAAWSHSPFAVEAERFLIQTFAAKFGLPTPGAQGTFTSGGMEANLTAILTALANHFPVYVERGLRSLDKQPTLYFSSESHHSLLKAARLCGVGSDAVRLVQVDDRLRMRPDSLRDAIVKDRSQGADPFFVSATAGATNSGIVDDLPEIARIAAEEGLWFHTDAAWGGGAALVPELAPLLAGIERSDSLTFDAHKWLSVPMGAGIFITRHPVMEETFWVKTAYMPKDAVDLDIVDPHVSSIQWSRRFIGLKVLLSVMVAGWNGYAAAIRHQTAMGELLRSRLLEEGWIIRNQTRLPVVCFASEGLTDGQLTRICSRVVRSGKAWISTTLLAGEHTVLRVCITNYRTGPEHVQRLVDALDRARRAER